MFLIHCTQLINLFYSRNEKIKHQSITGAASPYSRLSSTNEPQFELKLNITESQVVFVEDTSQWDTNAVILKVNIFTKENIFFLFILFFCYRAQL